jgi:hypothetical protein
MQHNGVQLSLVPGREAIVSMKPDVAPKKKRAPVPKEHGAWFMLGHCLLIGALVARSFGMPVWLIITASVLFFMAMQGLKQVARAFRHRVHGVPFRFPKASAGFLAGAVVSGVAAIVGWRIEALLIWGALSVVITATYAWILFQRKERSVLGEWLGILGLTLSAGAVWTAGAGRWDREALILWALSFLYFGGTVPFVRFRVKQMKAGSTGLGERMGHARNAMLYSFIVLALVGFLAALAYIPSLAVLPFALSLGKILWAMSRGKAPLKIAHVGYSEAVYSSLFAVLTIAAFWPGS